MLSRSEATLRLRYEVSTATSQVCVNPIYHIRDTGRKEERSNQLEHYWIIANMMYAFGENIA